ncbi:hypothetical protein FMK67_26330 [Klebsiella michiganensis]|nr:hypothetical protein [Klebsiella michiganensis]MBZ6747881.1 hypothetical protein [Klebsiella michiganensis]MBZ7238102.1 hypothetical protein [Klebsiella michiganensis]MBZ7416337.1 hypothetical protein [Klebsiella michiganensis]MBZ7428541.1 hypothetical protein [Klebsiella michiganensis]
MLKIVSSAMTDSLIIFIPCSGLPLQVNADAQDSPKSMSELLPLFQPECVFSYASKRLAADGLSVSSLYAPRYQSIRPGHSRFPACLHIKY